MSDKGIEFLKNFEGCSLNIYKCSSGYPTIGYGHKLKPDEDYDLITYEQAESILKNDLLHTERSVIRNIQQNLSQEEFDALVSFTFNLGGGALQRSSLRYKINSDIFVEPEDISAEFMRWVYSSGIKSSGLINRRKAEANLYNYGEY